MRLADRIVLVTGATGGLGEAICHTIAAEGGVVVATDLDVDACHQLTTELPSQQRHLALPLDVTEEAGWRDVVSSIKHRFGRLDALVNNAGIGGNANVVNETVENFNKIMSIDLTGLWLGMKHAGPLMEGKGGSIVNVSSILGIGGGLGDSAAYAAAKGAVTNLTKNAGLHWATKGVRVNSIHPGFIGTRQLLERYEGSERHQAMLANTPMKRLGKPEEIASVVAFMVSDESTYMTGSHVVVDGGWSAR
jgi:3alpha(or 20beta)-hydroxysteroid dehydrogenase